jgi:hypothetical protein
VFIEFKSSNDVVDVSNISSEPDVGDTCLSVLEDDVLKLLHVQLVLGEFSEDVSEHSYLVEMPDAYFVELGQIFLLVNTVFIIN